MNFAKFTESLINIVLSDGLGKIANDYVCLWIEIFFALSIKNDHSVVTKRVVHSCKASFEF